jgi:hypothetical protein
LYRQRDKSRKLKGGIDGKNTLILRKNNEFFSKTAVFWGGIILITVRVIVPEAAVKITAVRM